MSRCTQCSTKATGENQSVHTFKCLCPLLTQHRFYYTQEKKNNFHGTLEISVVESML